MTPPRKPTPASQRRAEARALHDAAALLVALREEGQLATEEIARGLGVTASYVSAVLGGYRTVSLRQLARITHTMGYRLVLQAEKES